MDRITAQLLGEFASEYDFSQAPQDLQFEHFVNLSVVARDYADSFDPSDVHVGGDSNPGIDGIAIIINGSLVTEVEEIDDLLQTNKYIEALFVFTQSKTSSSFNGADIGSFIEAVRDFFRESPRLVRGTHLQAKAALSEHIFRHSSKMRSNPKCSLYFVTTGLWTNDKNLSARLEQGQSDLMQTQLFSAVTVDALGAAEIQRLYRQSKETIDVEIEFANKVTLPSLPGVQQAFIGIIPASVLFSLICDEAGTLRRGVFEDNIRDFQGDTDVNNGMQDTLANADKAQTFVVLNNGITVVCRELQLTGNKCTLSGYQIVNGCQTSNVLFKTRGAFDADQVLIPIKLVSTQDEEIVNSIIRSTNSQNAVKPEELEAMTEFQKRLEQFFRTYTGPGQLFYERRSKQYVSMSVEKTRIVTIPNQIKAFASMFLGVPHRVSGYYGTVRSRMQNQIFQNNHRPNPYYASALALYRLECLFRGRLIGIDWKPLKWFLLMLLPRKLFGDPPTVDSKRIEEYCGTLIEALSDQEHVKIEIEDIITRISTGGLPDINKDTLKTQSLRDMLLHRLRQ